jgi:hypothetical protein
MSKCEYNKRTSKREYCCTSCGLIWFTDKVVANEIICPDCNNSMVDEYPIFACDTFSWFYAHDSVSQALREAGKTIHYYKDHPLYSDKLGG